MRVSTGVCAALLLLVVSAPAFAAGGAKGDWEIGGFVGQGWPDDYGPLNPENDQLYGGRLGYFLTRHVGLEGTVQRFSTTSRTLVPLDMAINSFRGNVLMNLAVETRFQPFLTVGLGADNSDFETFDTATELAVNAGGGFRAYLTPALALRLDGRWSQVHSDAFDEKEDNFEAAAGLSLIFGGSGHGEEHTESPPPAVNQPPTVSVNCDRPEIQPGESVNVSATATDPEGGPITYTWSSSAGRVSGEGANATLSFDGVTAPSTATISVRAMDDHGNSASAQCSVQLAAPAPPPQPEAASCMAGGFPRNLSRLTNVDKACLDDFVARLKGDPRAHAIVVGYADAHETSANRVSGQRASAVKDYLVQAGVESSRITTRTGGSSKPIESGTDPGAMARNRRVEVWFVPEGAKEPE